MSLADYEIICVDDDLDVLEITADQVESLGYKTKSFSKAEEASQYIEKNIESIALILSDLRMDNVNGFDFKKMILPFASEIPFVVITGYWTKEMSAQAMEIGIKSFLNKPVVFEEFQEAIEKFGCERALVLDEEKEMAFSFIEESGPMLDEIEALILDLEENPNSEDTLSVYFRLLHTIKGTAACVGLLKLGDYTHKYEDFIGELRVGAIPVNTITINILLQGYDDLKEYFEVISKTANDKIIQVEDATEKYTINQSFTDALTEEDVSNKQLETSDVGTSDSSNSKKEEDKMTVPMSVLNEFMEESGELTVIRNSILRTVKKIEAKFRGDQDIELLNDLLDGMYDVTSGIQGKIEDMRKITLKNTFRPFKRLVRDLSKQLNKDVDFVIEGEELSVDTVIAKLFSNTLIHILRNSLDHGLENRDERSVSGKNETGKLKIIIQEIADEIELVIEDDGKGIDPSIIYNKALEKELYTKDELDRMSDLEVINIVFASGFSTAEVVSDLSGRGVGMDMVKGSFEDMGGNVYVQSEKGVGSTFTLRVPVPKSVLIINSLLIKIANNNFFFHMDEVSEVICFDKEEEGKRINRLNESYILEHNGESIELLSMVSILGIDFESESDSYNIVILRVGEKRIAVLVEEIYDFEEVVSRTVSDKISSSDLYLGASLLGNGEVAMILSATGIATKAGIKIEDKKQIDILNTFSKGDDLVSNIGENEFMVFKYNIKDQLCVSLVDVDRFEKIKISDLEVIGNNIVVRYLDHILPIIDPAHLMGLKAVSQIKEYMDQGVDIDIDIIVSQNGRDKIGLYVFGLDEIQYSHEAINYETVNSRGLNGSIYLNGKTICLVDIPVLYNMYKTNYISLKKGGLKRMESAA